MTDEKSNLEKWAEQAHSLLRRWITDATRDGYTTQTMHVATEDVSFLLGDWPDKPAEPHFNDFERVADHVVVRARRRSHDEWFVYYSGGDASLLADRDFLARFRPLHPDRKRLRLLVDALNCIGEHDEGISIRGFAASDVKRIEILHGRFYVKEPDDDGPPGRNDT